MKCVIVGLAEVVTRMGKTVNALVGKVIENVCWTKRRRKNGNIKLDLSEIDCKVGRRMDRLQNRAEPLCSATIVSVG